MTTVTLTLTVQYDDTAATYSKQEYKDQLYDNVTIMIGNGGLTGAFYDAEVEDWSINFDDEK